MRARCGLVFTLWAFATAGCGDGSTAADAAPPDAAPIPTSIEIRFDRVSGSRELDVTATVLDEAGRPLPDVPVALSADRGTLTGTHLVPEPSGKHTITATAAGLTATRTALVVSFVNDTWNQPEPVRGLADTAGYEDSIQVSPDGEWLFLFYSPAPFNCLYGGDPADPSCHIVGPVDAPERPNLPGYERINADGTWLNGCPSLGAPSLPFAIPPLAAYGFHRQADGSYAEPFVLGFAGADGCATIYGIQLLDDARTLVYAWDNPVDSDPSQLYTAQITPGADVLLGTFTPALTGYIGTQLAAGNGNQGNPFAWVHGGGVDLIYDDEPNRQDLLVSHAASLSDGTWTAAATIPAPVSDPSVQESQPFVDGGTLYFRRDLTIWASDWNGGALDDAGSWSAAYRVMDGNISATGAGEILGVGEPSVAMVGGKRELYFVYVERTQDGLLDLGVGMVPAR